MNITDENIENIIMTSQKIVQQFLVHKKLEYEYFHGDFDTHSLS